MRAGFLIDTSNPDDPTKIPIMDSLLIGRADDCDYSIHDVAASRRHLKIEARDLCFFWQDLDSTNGVHLNEEKLSGGRLQQGDHIRIGSTTFVFELEGPEEEAPETTEEQPTELQERILESFVQSGGGTDPGEADVLLEAVHTVMNDIASNYEPCGLVDRILETTMKAIQGQRGAIFFASPDHKVLQPCPVCGHVHVIENGILRHTDTSEIQISNTVARKVLNDGESVLIQDTGADSNLDESISMIALNLRSIICAPVRGKSEVLGILYIDSDLPAHSYTHGHMLLSTAVGNSAGLALENARMHQEIVLKERMEREIELAGIIQGGFLMHGWATDDSRYEVCAETQPAKTVGGDFYDVVELGPDKIGLLIGDVSGKGVPSALAMAQILAEFRVHVTQESSPAAVMASLNASMYRRSQRGMFCTLCYLTVDLESGVVVCANAGHHSPLRVSHIEVAETSEATGPPIGIVDDAPWEDVEFTLEKGEAIFMYTDGIVEARAASTRHDGEDEPDEYGLESLKMCAGDLAAEAPEIVVREVLLDVERFCEPLAPHDDCTLLVMRYAK